MKIVNGVVDLRVRGFAPGMARIPCEVIIEYEDCTDEEITSLEVKALENITALVHGLPKLPHTLLIDSEKLQVMRDPDERYSRIHSIREMAVIVVDRFSISSCSVTLRATMLEPLPIS